VEFNPNCFLYSFFGLVVNGLAWFRQLISPIGIGAGIIVKKEINKKINGFDTEILLAEDYDYCTRSAKIGKFRMIRSIKLLYSSRRLENDGEFTTLFKWLKMGLFISFIAVTNFHNYDAIVVVKCTKNKKPDASPVFLYLFLNFKPK